VAPRFFASVSAAVAIFFADSSVSTFFTGKSARIGPLKKQKTTIKGRIRFICPFSRVDMTLLTQHVVFSSQTPRFWVNQPPCRFSPKVLAAG
jgi:hypothetical protein